MNRVEELIIKALNTADNNHLRQQAENTIFGLLRENPSEFFLTCAHIVADEGKTDKIRQSAASVMKAILAKRAENNEYFWDLSGANIRHQVKDVLLMNLISPNVLVMRAGANVIAQIASIEIPRGEWLDIVNSLAQNSMHDELNIRRASITTLGYICEELKNVRSNINTNTCQQILGSLLNGLRQTGDIVEISLTALRESISFLRNMLENESYCCQVFDFIFPFLATDFRNKVYEILFQFGKYCYHLLGNYINAIAQATVQHIDQRNDNSILALEFWDTIGTEYLRRMDENERIVSERNNIRNFIDELQDLILPHVMGSILILSKEDADFPELRESAVKTLTTFVACGSRRLVDKVTEGVTRVIQSANPGERQASALLFSCLVEYPDRDYVGTCFQNGFAHLYQLIEDPDVVVRRNTLNGFATLAEYFAVVFLSSKDIFNIFDHLLKLSNSPDEIVQILSLNILLNITDSLKEYPQCQIINEPDTILQALIASFTNNLNHNTNKQSNEKIIGIIMNIIMMTNKRQVIVMLLNHLISQYMHYSKIKMRDQEIILNQILAIIHTSVLAMAKFPVDIDQKRKIYDLLDQHVNMFGVEVEGIHLIGAIALCYKKEFLFDQFEKYWNIVLQGLEMIDQKQTFKGALTCLQDIARNNQNKLVTKLTPVYQKLINYMHNNIERQLKTEILRCFGDLTLGLKGFAQQYLKSVLQICDNCCSAVRQYSQIESEKEYAEQLKQALIEMYHCVVFALNEQNGNINIQLANHFTIISTFIVATCDIRLKPTVEYVKNCLGLIFDAALFYSRNKDYRNIVNQITSSMEINNLIDTLRKYKDREGVIETLAFIEDKMKNQRK